MTMFGKRRMNVTEWAKVHDRIVALQLSMGAPHDLMMFSTDTDDMALPDEKLMTAFTGFERIERNDLPDFLTTLVVREDGFRERFPDIAKKRRSKLG
jgi:hypothetical protein